MLTGSRSTLLANMAEKDDSCPGSASADVCRPSGDSPTQKPAEDDGSARSEPQFSPDLRSVLVTSVLNLEKLDVDLYR